MKEKLYINDTLSVLEAAGSHPEGSGLLRQQLFISLGQDWAECLLPLCCQVGLLCFPLPRALSGSCAWTPPAGLLRPRDSGWPWKALRGNKEGTGASVWLCPLTSSHMSCRGYLLSVTFPFWARSFWKGVRPQAPWGQKWLVSLCVCSIIP